MIVAVGVKLIDVVNCRASAHLVKLVRDYFGGEDSESWKEVKDLAVCFDSDTDLSHLLLTALYLANHTPSGKKGEGYTGWSRVTSSLCSPHFRVAMQIAKSLYPIHCKWIKFADGLQ